MRPLYLIPASAVAMRTPSTAGILGYFLGASGEMVADMEASGGFLEIGAGLPDTAAPRKAFRAYQTS